MKYCCECKETKPFDQFHSSVTHKGYAPRCKPCAIAVATSWYKANKDRKRAYDAKRRAEKRHLYRASSKRWREEHPGEKNAETQTRRAQLRGAYPKWANKFFIAEIYDLAARRTVATGINWVVDHEIPLRGKFVSGLHVETNLRVVPAAVNLAKSNHYSMTHEGIQ